MTRERRITAGADGKTDSQADDTARFWPPLVYPQWRDTATTFQLWTQIVGKVRLALSPWLNHGWQVPLYVNARGLGTSPIHAGRRIFEVDFDLAVTRFSGRMAPPHPGGVPGLPDAVTREAYSHEVSSAGFWAGNDKYPEAAFYSYAYPTPNGFEQANVEPVGASWSAEMGEWLLPYDVVRTAADPESALLSFLQTTYRAAADLATWDRALECDIGAPSRPRAVQPPEASATASSA